MAKSPNSQNQRDELQHLTGRGQVKQQLDPIKSNSNQSDAQLDLPVLRANPAILNQWIALDSMHPCCTGICFDISHLCSLRLWATKLAIQQSKHRIAKFCWWDGFTIRTSMFGDIHFSQNPQDRWSYQSHNSLFFCLSLVYPSTYISLPPYWDLPLNKLGYTALQV